MTNGRRHAYVFYATDDHYAVAALVFVQRLRQLGIGDDVDVVVLHLPLARRLVVTMREMGIVTRLVKTLPYTRARTYRDCLVKLKSFQLTEYDRVVYADADALPLKPLDGLFTLPFDGPLAAPRAYWLPQPYWTTMLLVVQPSTGLWDRVERHFATAAETSSFDMDIVNAEFGSAIWSLPAEIACLNSEWEDIDRPGFFPDPLDAYSRVSLVHFTALGKPWSYPPDLVRRLRPKAHPVFYELWETWWKTRDEIPAAGPGRARRRRDARAQPLAWADMPATGRGDSLGPALRLLHRIRPERAVIVETGTLRDTGARESDGWSTLAFAWFAARTGGRLYTIDVDARALSVAGEVTSAFAPAVSLVEGDSVRVLGDWDPARRGAIDLLYLDSLDWYDVEASERHCLAEARAALPHLAGDALILVDDTTPVSVDEHGMRFQGKGALAIPFLLAHGFEVAARVPPQVLLRRRVRTVDWDLRLRRVPGIEVRQVGAGYVAHRRDRDRAQYLNHTAVLVLELCTGAIRAGEVPGLLRDAYRLPEPPTAEVAECLATLLREGLVLPVEGTAPPGPDPGPQGLDGGPSTLAPLVGPRTFVEFERRASCGLCGHREFALTLPPDIQRCRRCRVLFRSPRPTQAEIQRSYESGATFAEWIPEEQVRRALWQARLDRLVNVGARGDLLDIGTGDGHFLVVASGAGFDVDATELSETGVGLSRARGVAVRQGHLTDLDFTGRTFDVITMWHVLEHVPNPGEVLRRTHELLRPGGILAVAVPNADHSLVWRRLGARRDLDLLERPVWGREIHLTHFQPGTLRAALRRAGFDVLEFGVDDTCTRRTAGAVAALRAHRLVSRLFGWHLSVAMYFLCRRR